MSNSDLVPDNAVTLIHVSRPDLIDETPKSTHGDRKCWKDPRHVWIFRLIDSNFNKIATGWCCTYGSIAPCYYYGYAAVYDTPKTAVTPCPNCTDRYIEASRIDAERISQSVDELESIKENHG